MITNKLLSFLIVLLFFSNSFKMVCQIEDLDFIFFYSIISNPDKLKTILRDDSTIFSKISNSRVRTFNKSGLFNKEFQSKKIPVFLKDKPKWFDYLITVNFKSSLCSYAIILRLIIDIALELIDNSSNQVNMSIKELKAYKNLSFLLNYIDIIDVNNIKYKFNAIINNLKIVYVRNRPLNVAPNTYINTRSLYLKLFKILDIPADISDIQKDFKLIEFDGTSLLTTVIESYGILREIIVDFIEDYKNNNLNNAEIKDKAERTMPHIGTHFYKSKNIYLDIIKEKAKKIDLGQLDKLVKEICILLIKNGYSYKFDTIESENSAEINEFKWLRDVKVFNDSVLALSNQDLKALEEAEPQALYAWFKSNCYKNNLSINNMFSLISNPKFYNKIINIDSFYDEFRYITEFLSKANKNILDYDIAKSILIGMPENNNVKNSTEWIVYNLSKAKNNKYLISYIRNWAYNSYKLTLLFEYLKTKNSLSFRKEHFKNLSSYISGFISSSNLLKDYKPKRSSAINKLGSVIANFKPVRLYIN